MQLEEFEAIITAFFIKEIHENPKVYSIQMINIPVLDAREYVQERVEKMRQRLATVVIRHFLKRQSGPGKILLYKIIDHNLKGYMQEYTAKILKDHYRDWYVITKLNEIREINKNI